MTTPSAVLAAARGRLGLQEDPAGSNKVEGITAWYGMVGPWCAMFVSRCFHDAGLPLPASTDKGFAYTPSGANWFKAQQRWAGPTVIPEPGWVIFFDFPNDGVNRISHVGIVESFRATDGAVITIEGNTDEAGGRTGGKVMRRARKVGIVGYGIPAFDNTPEIEVVPATPKEPARPVIRRGSKGEHVKHWQWALEHVTGVKLRGGWDGDFGRATHNATVNFQRFFKLRPDGIVGPQTWGLMNYLIAIRG